MNSLVIGEALVDEIHETDGSIVRKPGGSPFNIAIGLARLGLSVSLLSDIGTDVASLLLTDRLADSGVTLGAIPSDRTSFARATLDAHGAATYEFEIHWAPVPSRGSIDGPWSHVHVGSIAAFLPATTDLVLSGISDHPEALRTFDPNIRTDILSGLPNAKARFHQLCGSCDVVKLSDEDASWLNPTLDGADFARSLLDLGPRLVVVTRGPKGACLYTDRHAVEVPAADRQVVDTIGAGDAFMSALIYALLSRQGTPGELEASELLEIGGFASAASGIVITREGANPPMLAELTAAL